MASSRGSTASSKPPKQRLAVTAQSATSKPWFTCSQPNSISCFQTEIVATHAKQRRTRNLNAKALGGLVGLLVVMAALLFIPAWTLDYGRAWTFLAVFGGSTLAITL